VSEERSAVDRVYDTLERGAETLGAILGVDVRDDAQKEIAERRARDAAASRGRVLGAVSRKPFEIDEVIDGATGKPVYVLTDGVDKHDCPAGSDRAYAERVLAALRTKGAR